MLIIRTVYAPNKIRARNRGWCLKFNNLYIAGCILRTVREYAYCSRVYRNKWNIYCCDPYSCNSNRVNYHLSRYCSITIDSHTSAYTNFQVNQHCQIFRMQNGKKFLCNVLFFRRRYCKINRAICNLRISNILTLDILRVSAGWEIPSHSVGLFKKNCIY